MYTEKTEKDWIAWLELLEIVCDDSFLDLNKFLGSIDKQYRLLVALAFSVVKWGPTCTVPKDSVRTCGLCQLFFYNDCVRCPLFLVGECCRDYDTIYDQYCDAVADGNYKIIAECTAKMQEILYNEYCKEYHRLESKGLL